MGDHDGDGGVTRSGLRYQPPSPTSLVIEENKVIMNNKSSILPSNIVAPLIWDMDGGFWGHERPLTLFGCSGHHRVGGFHSGI